MPLACQLSECHFHQTTKTLPNTRKLSTLVRGPRSLTLIAGTGAILDTADVVPLRTVWTAGPLAHKPVIACPGSLLGAPGRTTSSSWRTGTDKRMAITSARGPIRTTLNAWFDDGHLVPDDHGSCKGPAPDRHRIVRRLRVRHQGPM